MNKIQKVFKNLVLIRIQYVRNLVVVFRTTCSLRMSAGWIAEKSSAIYNITYLIAELWYILNLVVANFVLCTPVISTFLWFAITYPIHTSWSNIFYFYILLFSNDFLGGGVDSSSISILIDVSFCDSLFRLEHVIYLVFFKTYVFDS